MPPLENAAACAGYGVVSGKDVEATVGILAGGWAEALTEEGAP